MGISEMDEPGVFQVFYVIRKTSNFKNLFTLQL